MCAEQGRRGKKGKVYKRGTFRAVCESGGSTARGGQEHGEDDGEECHDDGGGIDEGDEGDGPGSEDEDKEKEYEKRGAVKAPKTGAAIFVFQEEARGSYENLYISVSRSHGSYINSYIERKESGGTLHGAE